jgi:hypothetical protein
MKALIISSGLIESLSLPTIVLKRALTSPRSSLSNSLEIRFSSLPLKFYSSVLRISESSSNDKLPSLLVSKNLNRRPTEPLGKSSESKFLTK